MDDWVTFMEDTSFTRISNFKVNREISLGRKVDCAEETFNGKRKSICKETKDWIDCKLIYLEKREPSGKTECWILDRNVVEIKYAEGVTAHEFIFSLPYLHNFFILNKLP